MGSDDRIRAAFDDLERQVRSEVSTRQALERTVGSRRWAGTPALVAAALVVVLIGGAAVLDLLPGDPDTTIPPATQPDLSAPSTPEPTSEVPGSSAPTTEPGEPTTTQSVEPTVGPDAPLYRVDDAAVSADTSDPFLNVREDPDPSAPIVEKLPPTYSALIPTGGVVELDSGAVWWEVDLGLPVRSGPIDPASATGWVNAAYLVALPQGSPVTEDEVPACSASVDGEFNDAGGQAAIGGVVSVDLGDGCTRSVVSFVDAAGPVAQLPGYGMSVSAHPLQIDVDVDEVSVASGDVLYVARGWDGHLDLVGPGVEQAWMTPLPDRGLLVVDTVGTTPPRTPLVALTREPSVGQGTIAVEGLARPFEASLGVTIEDASGNRVEAVYSGTWEGTVRADAVGVPTLDWTEAWGRFAVEASGLPAGEYVLILDPGAESQDVVLRVPFTVDDGAAADAPSADANSIASAMRSFASDPSQFDQIPFDPEVTLGLMEGRTDQFVRADLADPATWQLDVDGYRARSGSADLLAELRRPVRITEGEIPHCASPPAPIPNDLAGFDRINLEPIGITSCIDWFSLSLFVDGGDVVGVLYDLYEP